MRGFILHLQQGLTTLVQLHGALQARVLAVHQLICPGCSAAWVRAVTKEAIRQLPTALPGPTITPTPTIATNSTHSLPQKPPSSQQLVNDNRWWHRLAAAPCCCSLLLLLLVLHRGTGSPAAPVPRPFQDRLLLQPIP